jgi:hypothetical protein
MLPLYDEKTPQNFKVTIGLIIYITETTSVLAAEAGFGRSAGVRNILYSTFAAAHAKK